MEATRQRVVRRRKLDHAQGRRRREGDEIRRVVVVREDERLALLELLAQGAQLGDGEERTSARADGADPLEAAVARDAAQLFAEVERLGPRRDHRGAGGAERARGFGIGGHRDEWRELRLLGAREHGCADGDLDRVETRLDIGRPTTAEEQQEGAGHRGDDTRRPISPSTRARNKSARRVRRQATTTWSPPVGTARSTASHCGSLQLKILDGSSFTFTGRVSQDWSYTRAAALKMTSDHAAESKNTARMKPSANQPPRTPHARPTIRIGARSSRNLGPKTRPPHHSAYVAYRATKMIHAMTSTVMRRET